MMLLKTYSPCPTSTLIVTLREDGEKGGSLRRGDGKRMGNTMLDYGQHKFDRRLAAS